MWIWCRAWQMDSFTALVATSLLSSSVTSCTWHQVSSWPMCLPPDAVDPDGRVLGEISGHCSPDRTTVHDTMGIGNLPDIPTSAAVWHHAPSTTARTLNLMRCPHGALTNSALRVKSHLAKSTLSCCIRGGCPARAVEAGCFWKQRNKSRTPALLSWFGFQHKKQPGKRFRCFWLVIPSFPSPSLASWQTV